MKVIKAVRIAVLILTYYEFYSLPRAQEIPEGYKEISFICLRPEGVCESPSTVGIMCRTANRQSAF